MVITPVKISQNFREISENKQNSKKIMEDLHLQRKSK